MGASFLITAPLRKLLENLKGAQVEKNIAYMYVDTVGEITVGVGHNLDANGDLLDLPFTVKRFERHPVIGGDAGTSISTNRVTDRRATATEIQNDHDFLKRHKGLGKFAPEQLQKYTTLELSSAAVDQLFINDIDIAVAVARREFGEAFDKFPVTCQAALIDIAFNCGTFQNFLRSKKEQNFLVIRSRDQLILNVPSKSAIVSQVAPQNRNDVSSSRLLTQIGRYRVMPRR